MRNWGNQKLNDLNWRGIFCEIKGGGNRLGIDCIFNENVKGGGSNTKVNVLTVF